MQSQQTPTYLIKPSDDEFSVFRQLKEFRSKIPKELLTEWEKPSGLITFRMIAQDWVIIVAASQLYIRYPSTITFLIAIVLFSWGQRGLSNLVHDSIHHNLVRSRKWNDVIADVFLTPAFLTTVKLQRDSHAAHHHYLGTAADPDHGLHNETSLKHYRTGHTTDNSIISLFLYDLLDLRLWFQNAIGSLISAPFLLCTWWTALALFTGLLETPSVPTSPVPIGSTFLFLYHFTRLTLTHIFYVLRETIDHSGLPPSGIFAFTRSSPCCNLFQRFLQPHDDNYHLLHHLLPRIPMTRLHKAHVWLVENCEVYREANTRSETYFSGRKPLFGGVISQAGTRVDDEKSVVFKR